VTSPRRRRVLMLAYHFPPYVGSSGARRTIAFVRYLRDYGWEPTVLSVGTGAYERTSDDELAKLPPGVEVVRPFVLDVARHLSIAGRYPSRLAVPDRWASWRYTGFRAGLETARRIGADVVWSTYPIATAHALAARIARASGLPWVADMRDPMVEFDAYSGIAYPTDPRVREARLRIERTVVESASRVVFCTGGALAICRDRYGAASANRFAVIPNGYDEEEFSAALSKVPSTASTARAGFTLVHSGTVYPGDDRSPGPLFRALGALRAEGMLPHGFRLVLRATGYDAIVAGLAHEAGVTDLVEIAPSLPYGAALQEMVSADALLLLQGSASNPAIPAKLYEYLRARRPILGLTHPDGETHALLQRLNAATLARLDDADSIRGALRGFFAGCTRGDAPLAADADVERFSRRAQTGDLARLLAEVARS
jgi:hypothetical protein